MQSLTISFYKGLFFLIVLTFFVQCSHDKKPAQVLSEAEMTRILIEVYIDEEKIGRLNLNRDSAEKIFELARPYIFERVGIPDSVFIASYNYYAAHPVELEKIYSVVVDSLNLREQKLMAAPATQ
jgi:hypothetical protein